MDLVRFAKYRHFKHVLDIFCPSPNGHVDEERKENVAEINNCHAYIPCY